MSGTLPNDNIPEAVRERARDAVLAVMDHLAGPRRHLGQVVVLGPWELPTGELVQFYATTVRVARPARSA